ncbi:hypothetical protein ACH5RR_026692 [Cinchona calisaya]|uniref:Uncharacterized protein n=1 Tax=Cinchona calisaya TaxID=153742 RepID=A0ABD2Z6P9_9GENT
MKPNPAKSGESTDPLYQKRCDYRLERFSNSCFISGQSRIGRLLRKGISQAVSSVLVTPGKASVKLRKRDVPKAACFQLNNMAPPLAEAKRLKSELKNVASLGLYVQQSTSSRREGYRTYKSLPVLTEALSYQSSSTTAVSYSPARRVAF